MPDGAARDRGRAARLCGIIRERVRGYEPCSDVRFSVFPEIAKAAPVCDSVQKLLDRLALPLPNGHTERHVPVCKELDCSVQTGTDPESDADFPGMVVDITPMGRSRRWLSKSGRPGLKALEPEWLGFAAVRVEGGPSMLRKGWRGRAWRRSEGVQRAGTPTNFNCLS